MRLTIRETRWQRGAALVAVAAGLSAAGCAERLDGSAACPITCVDEAAQIQTVTLDAVTGSATVQGGLGKGTEQRMLLSARGDTLDTRVILRFDSLPARTLVKSGDTTTAPITTADNARLILHVDSTAVRVGGPVTLSLYDVDTAAVNDTAAAVLQSLFVPARLITSQQFAAGALVDSVNVAVPSSAIVSRIRSGRRLRLGLKIGAQTSVSVRIASSELPTGPVLSFRTTPDTIIKPVVLVPNSATPSENRSIARALGDFTIVVKGTPVPGPNLIAVGGLPATRGYLTFAIPPRIVDSSIVVRATLLLTQVPSASPDPADSMQIRPTLVLAGPSVTDPAKAAQIDSALAAFAPLHTLPGSSGVREVDIAPAFRFWAAQPASQLPRAMDIKSAQEDYSPQQTLFYATTAANPAVRPKLRISYTFRSRIGVP